MFELDPHLQRDTVVLGDFPLCRLLLMNDRSYPWFILVPRRRGAREIHHLATEDQQQLWRESAELSRWIEQNFSYDKLNVAALGNIVSQLHLHHVARSIGDPAWPGPVWGARPAVAYAAAEVIELRQLIQTGNLREFIFECSD
ncbi:MAG TPA: HIT domain-containing protein [Malonomonas sp.]